MKRSVKIAAVVLGVLGVGGYFGYQAAAPMLMQAALESGAAGNFAEDIAAADANQDGQITRSEASGMVAQAFDTLDGNGNNIIDAEEIQTVLDYINGGSNRAPTEELVVRYMTLDTDGDGVLAKSELAERFHSLIVRADANGDDSVTTDELTTLLDAEAAPEH